MYTLPYVRACDKRVSDRTRGGGRSADLDTCAGYSAGLEDTFQLFMGKTAMTYAPTRPLHEVYVHPGRKKKPFRAGGSSCVGRRVFCTFEGLLRKRERKTQGSSLRGRSREKHEHCHSLPGFRERGTLSAPYHELGQK